MNVFEMGSNVAARIFLYFTYKQWENDVSVCVRNEFFHCCSYKKSLKIAFFMYLTAHAHVESKNERKRQKSWEREGARVQERERNIHKQLK